MNEISGLVPGTTEITGNIMATVLKGLSAYEVAVKNGFEGTETEWLQTLVGDSVDVEVVENTRNTYILKFTAGETVITTPNLKPVLEKGVDYLTPEEVEELTNDISEGVKADLGDTYQPKGNYVAAEEGKSLISDTEIARLADVHNYDDTEVKTDISNKVDKVTGKSLISDTEITRLASVDNYDDTEVKSDISSIEGQITQINSSLNNKVDAEEGKSLILESEIERLASVENYNDTDVKTDISDLKRDKADKNHTHTKADIGLGRVDNTSDLAKPVSTATQTAIDGAYTQATGYTDEKIAELIGGAPETLDTLKEIADAMEASSEVVEALNQAIGTKANETDFNAHATNETVHITAEERSKWNGYDTNKVDKVSGMGLSSNDYTTSEKNKLALIANGAEVNVQADWNQTSVNHDGYIKNKPTSLPASDVKPWAKADTKPSYALSELSDDATHRLVTDEQIAQWNQGGSSEDFDKLEDDIYDSTLIRDISLDTAEQGFVQWGRSSLSANTKYYHSEKIKMLKNDIIKVKAKGYVTSSFAGVTIISIASSTGWYEGVVNSADSTLRDYEWKATKDCDVIVCFEYSQVDNTTIRVIKATNFEDYIREEVSVFEDAQIKERATRDEKANDFVWKSFDKAYFAFVIDDANEHLYPMYQTFHANNVPLGAAVTTENIVKEVSGVGTRKDVVDLIIADGGECLSHYSGNLYSIGATVPQDGKIYLNTKKDWDEKIRDAKKDLISMGFNPRGVILADYSELRGKTGEEYCRAYFEYSDGMGSSTQYNLRRKFVSSFATIDAFKEWIDSKAGTKGFYPICLHGTEAVASTSNMDTIIKYILAKGNGVAITTYANVIDTFGSHSLNEGKVDKVPGKGLSTNDYTSAEKAKLASLENYNDAEIRSEISELNNDLTIASVSTSTTISDSADGYIRDFEAYGKAEQTQLSGTNICGVGDRQYIANLRAGDKIFVTNNSSVSTELYMFTNYGDTTRNDFWAISANATRAITVAMDSEAIRFVDNMTAYEGLIWANRGESALPYEPYCGGIPSPNPSYPQEIKSWDGDVRTHGKNLLNCTMQTATQNGVTCTRVNNSDGSLSHYIVNGTATGECNFDIVNGGVKTFLEDGITYRLIGCPANGTSSTYRLSFWGGYGYEYGNGINFKLSNLDKTNTYLYINIRNGCTCNNLIFKPMICEDTTAKYSDFVPYHSTLASLGISLYGIKVASGGNYTDSDGQMWIADKLDLRKGVVERYVGSVSKKANSLQGLYFYFNTTDAKLNSVCVSNKVRNKKSSAGYGSEMCCTLTSTSIILRNDAWNPNSDKTIDDLGVVDIVYPLATPTTETLTDAQISALRNLQTYTDGTFVEYGTLQPFASIDYFTSTENGKAVAEVDAKASESISELSEKFDDLDNLKSDLDNLSEKIQNSYVTMTNTPLSGMASGWYLVFALEVSWGKAKIWIQIVSGKNVYISYSDDTFISIA